MSKQPILIGHIQNQDSQQIICILKQMILSLEDNIVGLSVSRSKSFFEFYYNLSTAPPHALQFNKNLTEIKMIWNDVVKHGWTLDMESSGQALLKN